MSSGRKKRTKGPGRPLGHRNMKTIVRTVALERVPINDGGEERMVTIAEALLIQLQRLAMTGDIAADKALKKLVARFNPPASETAGVLLAPAQITPEEWVRQAQAENKHREPPLDVKDMFPGLSDAGSRPDGPNDPGPDRPKPSGPTRPPAPIPPSRPNPLRDRLIR